MASDEPNADREHADHKSDDQAGDDQAGDDRQAGLLGRIAWPAAILGPSVMALVLVPLRTRLDPINVALILVVVVVAVAALGRRLPGLVAALAAGLAFDFWWTRPYNTFSIDNPDLIQTAVLLVVVGAAVSELAWLGRHARQQVVRSRGYVAGAVDVVATFDPEADPEARVRLVEQRISDILGCDSCRYRAGPVPGGDNVAILASDGSVSVGGHRTGVGSSGLPTDRTIEIPVIGGGQQHGYLSVTAASRWSRPSSEQRQAAVLMAAQLGEILARSGQPTR